MSLLSLIDKNILMKNFENNEVDYVKIYEWIELEDKRQKRQKRQSVKKNKRSKN